jgi:hypothetical protein
VEFFFHVPVSDPEHFTGVPVDPGAEPLTETLTTPALPSGFVPVPLHSVVVPVFSWGTVPTG